MQFHASGFAMLWILPLAVFVSDGVCSAEARPLEGNLPPLSVTQFASPPSLPNMERSSAISSSYPPTIAQAESGSEPILQVQGALKPGDANMPSDSSLYDEYTFEGQAGQAVTIRLESTEFDTRLTLLDSEGEVIEENDDIVPANTNSILILTLPVDDIYQIRVNAYSDQSQGSYTLSVAPATESEMQWSEAERLLQQGIQQYITSQFQEALQSWETALMLYREPGVRAAFSKESSLGEANSLNNAGSVYLTIGEPQQALDCFNQALPIHQTLDNQTQQAETLSNIGAAYRALGQPQQALGYYNQALPIFQAVGNRAGEATTLNNIGFVYDAIGQLQRALNYFDQALPIRQELGDRVGEATTLNNIAGVHNALGQPQQALDSLKQVLLIFQAENDLRGEATTLHNIGAVHNALGQSQQALDYFSQALPIRQALGDRVGEAITLNNMGEVYSNLGQPQRALDYFNQALPILQQAGDRVGEATTLHNISFVYEEQGNLVEAIEFYRQSIEITESIQGDIQLEELKSSFASGQNDTYSRLINLLAEQGNFTDAFNYTERAKARAFLAQLANGHIDFRSGADASLLQQEQDLRSQITTAQTQLITLNNPPQDQRDEEAIAETNNRLDSLQQQYADLLTRIKLQSPETASLVTVNVAPLEEIQSLLEPDTTLVEYFVTSDRTFAFILTRDSFNTVPIEVTQAELTEQIRLFRDFADLSEAHPAELQQLHQWLIAPLQPYFSTDRLIIVPHGILHYLPFTALTDGNQYLSQDYILSLLPSANTLRYLPEQGNAPNGTLLALGNPTITDRQLTPLNHAQSEVEMIASLFNTQPLVNSAATESAIRSDGGNANILHLAVHGEYNPINPLFSTLHLASDTQQDGRLEVHEIFSLNLTNLTNLVVLSACQTSIGELSQGDEIVGLNRAFLYAGTPAVMASLWNVDDAATGMLMERFYSHLQNGSAPAKALQQAQQEIRQQPDYAHPYFWSAFSVTGH